MRELATVFLVLGCTAFGGPAAHVALMQRELVDRRRWIGGREFLDLLAVSNLIPGPTSTELAMHIGRRRGGWAGLIVAGLAFILPAAILVGVLAAWYVRFGPTPWAASVIASVQPVVVVVVLQALVPLGRSALTSVSAALVGLSAALAAPLLGEIGALLGAGVLMVLVTRGRQSAVTVVALFVALSSVIVAAQGAAPVSSGDLVMYFARTGSLLFGSGYVLFPVLQGDLVERLGWLTDRQLLDAIAVGQATPGPLFTTATFVGYLLGGTGGAVAATVAMFLPAFLFTALASAAHDRLSRSRVARMFLDGVNAAAVALIALVVVSLARTSWANGRSLGLAALAAVALFALRVPSPVVLAASALVGLFAALPSF